MKTVVVIGIIMLIILIPVSAFALEEIDYTQREQTNEIIALRDETLSRIDRYEELYGSRTYGWTAFILGQIRWFSIPICFLGIAVRSHIPIRLRDKKIRHET
ncbi:MAG: hypothetical protein FWC68_05655 [Oscillospiraceae bacterium]|nr:hypothetical protein [Oscillospiraceae bacterium]